MWDTNKSRQGTAAQVLHSTCAEPLLIRHTDTHDSTQQVVQFLCCRGTLITAPSEPIQLPLLAPLTGNPAHM